MRELSKLNVRDFGVKQKTFKQKPGILAKLNKGSKRIWNWHKNWLNIATFMANGNDTVIQCV